MFEKHYQYCHPKWPVNKEVTREIPEKSEQMGIVLNSFSKGVIYSVDLELRTFSML